MFVVSLDKHNGICVYAIPVARLFVTGRLVLLEFAFVLNSSFSYDVKAISQHTVYSVIQNRLSYRCSCASPAYIISSQLNHVRRNILREYERMETDGARVTGFTVDNM